MFVLDIPTILQNGGWAGKQWGIREDMKDYSKLEWLDQSDKPTEQQLLNAELATAKIWSITKSKEECQTRIYATYPIWKQANCANGFYDESTTIAIKSGIQAFRTAQTQAESDINALETVAAVLAFTW